MKPVGTMLMLLAAFTLEGCTKTAVNPSLMSVEEAKELDEAANRMLEQMTPAQRREIEGHINDQIAAVAAACGTTVSFTEEPVFEDRSLLIASGATSDQVACIHKQYPFAKPQR